MKKGYSLSIVLTLLALLFVVSCSNESESTEFDNSDVNDSEVFDNSIESTPGVGLKVLEFDIPIIPKLEPLLEDKTYVLLEFMGADDHIKYYLHSIISPDEEAGIISFKVLSTTLYSMPHQQYYINGISYASTSLISRAEELTSDSIELIKISLGATISLEDVDNIYFVSTFVAGSNTIFTYTMDSVTATSITTIPICSESDLLYNFTYPMDGVDLTAYSSIFTTPAFSKEVFQSNQYCFQLTDDIEITETMAPIGSNNIIDGGALPFTEIFDGQYFTISYRASELDEASFIHTLGDGAIIKNLFIDCNLDTGNNSGGLASYVEKGAAVTIQNCIVAGEISCPNLTTSKQVGGFIANVQSGSEVSFTSCASYVDMISTSSSSESFGGFVGIANSAKSLNFDNCTFFGSIYDISESLGGYIGYVNNNTSSITFENCATAGTISGGTRVGGYIGYLYSTNTDYSVEMEDSTVGGLLDFSYNYQTEVVECDRYDRLLSLHCTTNSGCAGGVFGELNSKGGVYVSDVSISELYLYTSSIYYGMTYGVLTGSGSVVGVISGTMSIF